MPTPRLYELLQSQFENSETQWSLGTFGGVAEFSRDSQEPAEIVTTKDSFTAVTARGGILISSRPEIRPVASESLTRDNWSHRIALCLFERDSAMSGRKVLTELGPDLESLRKQDRADILFDLGLGAQQVDACIRVSDSALVSELRRFAGQHVFEPGNPVMGIIVPASPHRVFMSPIGRIEVFQAIPPPHGRSPDGPHTHVLPKLLQHGRTHAATEQIPNGLVPCAHFYPSHPMKRTDGSSRPFEIKLHEDFQKILSEFGDRQSVDLKRKFVTAIEQGMEPSALTIPDDRFSHASVRIALRQLTASKTMTPLLERWLLAYDRYEPATTESDMEHGHDHGRSKETMSCA